MLIDTGASETAVAGRVIDSLLLRAIGFHSVTGFGSTNDAHQYIADIELDLNEAYLVRELPVLRFDSRYDRIQGLIGGDVLGEGTFTLDGPNRVFSLEF